MSRILKIAVPVPIRRVFDYLPPADLPLHGLRPGTRLLVPFGRRYCVGFLLEMADAEDIETSRLKRAVRVLDENPLLSGADCAVLRWASAYYHHPIGEVFASAFPVVLRRGRPAREPQAQTLCITPDGRQAKTDSLGRARRQNLLLGWLQQRDEGIGLAELTSLDWNWSPPAHALIAKGWAYLRQSESVRRPACDGASTASSPILNDEQKQALDALRTGLGRFGVFLLAGVTGSGKTEVYLHAVAEVLARDEQALVLLPEISLTPQLQASFQARFDEPIVVSHSGLNESERLQAWLAMQKGDAPVMLGTRSAAFTPLRRPGLIVLDEEHDTSFKQQEGFHFSARDLAVMRARQLNIPIILGSATPSLESLRNAREGRYRLLRLPQRIGNALPPAFRIIDIRRQPLREGLSTTLIAQIGETLARGEQTFVFLNRRGFAPTLICHGCGWVAECRRCDAHLVMHAGERRLRCHHCGHEQPLPDRCPGCQTTELRPLGLGTERVEQALAELFPRARIARIDRDTTRRKGRLGALLNAARAGDIDILLGTQMLAKGHHFPNVTLAAILDVDAGFFSLDFRASERTAQLILQVAGRAGRETRSGLVLLQTRNPDHPLLQALLRGGYETFADTALCERRAAMLPPYSHQALWRAEAADPETPRQLLERVKDWTHAPVLGLGPVPAPLARVAGRWRWQFLSQCTERKPLHALVETVARCLDNSAETRRARWSVDIDPLDWS